MEKQRWEESEKRRAEERRSEKRKSQKKEDASARNGRKVAKHCVCPMICGSQGSKSRLAEAAGAEPSGQMRDEKVHAVVARSKFASEKAKNTSFGALLEVEMSKKCTQLWREAHFEVKMCKTHQVRSTFGSWDVEKVWKSTRCCCAKHISKSKMLKAQHRITFWHSDVVSRGRCKGLCTLSEVSKTWGFCSISKNDGRRGTFLQRIGKDAFSVAGAVQETCSSEMLGGPGADVLRGIAFWSIRSLVLGRCLQVRHFVWHGNTFSC